MINSNWLYIYSLRISSTNAVSRSSPISLYFSFSKTSSSIYDNNKNNNQLKIKFKKIYIKKKLIKSKKFKNIFAAALKNKNKLIN